MRKWRTLAAAFVAAAATLTVVTVTTQSTAGADPNNPTFITVPFPGGKANNARAFDVALSGVINVAPTADANCSRGQLKPRHVVSVVVPGLATVTGLEASCFVNSSGSKAASRATIADVNLLNGKIKIKLIDSRCGLSGGYATFGSTWGSMVFDQNYSRNGSGAIVIPGIATVVVDAKFANASGVYTTMVAVNLLNGQTIVVGACSITRHTLS
jgi:hypothetical protein